MGKKYLLEIEENKDGSFAWSNFAPYTAPDLEQVRKEAYEEGRKVGIKDGMYEAWKAARFIADMPYGEEEKAFGSGGWAFIVKHTASEAIEKIRQYEQKKREEEQEKSIRSEDVMRQYLDTFCKRNFCTKCLLHTPDFTCGRGYHFLTKNPVSDEEVRRAYAKVVKE